MSLSRWLPVAVLVGAAALAAQAGPERLPFVQPLDVDRVELVVHRGRVDIVVDPGRVPSIRVSDLVRGDETEGFVVIEDLSDGFIVSQPHGAEEVAPPLAVEIVLAAGQNVRVEGSDVAVTVRGADVPADLEDPEPEAGEPLAQPSGKPRSRIVSLKTSLPIVLDLTGGTLVLEGVRDVHVTARGTSVALARTIGEIDIAVADAVVEVDGHRGPLILGGVRSEFELTDARTSAAAYLDESLLSIMGGYGRVMADGRRGDLIATAWSGSVSVLGEEMRAEIGESGTANETLSMRGNDQELSVYDWSGAVSVDLIGGRVDLRKVSGAVKATASSGVTSRFEDLSEELVLKLDQASGAVVQNIGRRLQARLHGSRLDAVGVRELDVKATDSTLVAEKIFGRTKVVLTDSEADLDLTGIHASPQVEAKGSSNARIVMSEPCSVRSGSGGSFDDLAERTYIDGCQVLTSDRRRPVIRSRTGSPPTVLALTVGELASVDVRARP